jgi:hypothetical protein
MEAFFAQNDLKNKNKKTMTLFLVVQWRQHNTLKQKP